LKFKAEWTCQVCGKTGLIYVISDNELSGSARAISAAHDAGKKHQTEKGCDSSSRGVYVGDVRLAEE